MCAQQAKYKSHVRSVIMNISAAVLKALLDQNAAINIVEIVKKVSVELLGEVLARNAVSVDQGDSKQNTPLHVAVDYKRSSQIVAMLSSAGVGKSTCSWKSPDSFRHE